MTADEFELHVYGPSRGCYVDKGKSRLNRLCEAYRAYLAAYHEPSLAKLLSMSFVASRPGREGIRQAAKDRDAGLPCVLCPELLTPATGNTQ